MKPRILSLGELLVEIMRERRGEPLDVCGTFRGPFASGAPAIFSYAAARLGAEVGFTAVVGKDAFGQMCVARLREVGIDVSGVRTTPGYTTGIAFVSYATDGSRDFLFHLPQSAAALLEPDDVRPDVFAAASWLHLTGSSLALSASARAACLRAAEIAVAGGAILSFDPNLRAELSSQEEIRAWCAPILKRATVVLPSGEEASLLTGIADPDEACRALLDEGPELVALKLGNRGCKLFTHEAESYHPAPSVEEIDPTGAGDCFAAGFAVAYLEGMALGDCAHFANIVGALSVTRFGPLEGAPTREEVELYRS